MADDGDLGRGVYTTAMISLIIMITMTLGSLIFLCLISVIIWVQHRSKGLLPHLRNSEDGKKKTTIGFFHPYCNAGGGGERVLWVAIRSLYNKYPDIRCVVYTGDTDATRDIILSRAKQRFDITLPKPVEFVFLKKRDWVEASPYPYFTLLCQSLGSIVLGWEAMMKYVPDIYIDTMGYAFTLPLFRIFGGCKVACYVHYPTISTDMLERVAQRTATYNNAGFISRSPILSQGKLLYYKLFAYLYGLAGRSSKIVMVNSTWTEGHILDIWRAGDRTSIVYPPCDTKGFVSLPLTDKSKNKIQSIVSVAQFRPEKDHPLQLEAFKKFIETKAKKDSYKLVLVGGCRNEGDESRVESLRGLAKKLNIEHLVEFRLNVPFPELKQAMADATVGLHTMLDEHFGIGVVELMAAGTLTIAHNSGGPKLDIVVDHNGSRTGYLADSVDTYAEALDSIFNLTPEESQQIRANARDSVGRFSDEEFDKNFLSAIEPIISIFID